MSRQLYDAVADDNSRAILRALRGEIWASLTDQKTGGRDIAALVMRWLEVSEKLDDKTRAGLMDLRRVIVRAIDRSESGRDVAALAKRLMDVQSELDSLPDTGAKKSAAQKAREMVRKRVT